MADLSQTAANVGLTSTSGATVSVVQAGEAITQGQPLYLSSGKYYKADADAGSAEAAAVAIALTPATTDEYLVVITAGRVDLGATLTVGETYVVSGTAGAVAPIGDLATGDYVTHLGVAKAADALEINFNATGTQVP